MRVAPVLLVLLVLAAGGCRSFEQLPLDVFIDRNPQEDFSIIASIEGTFDGPNNCDSFADVTARVDDKAILVRTGGANATNTGCLGFLASDDLDAVELSASPTFTVEGTSPAGSVVLDGANTTMTIVVGAIAAGADTPITPTLDPALSLTIGGIAATILDEGSVAILVPRVELEGADPRLPTAALPAGNYTYDLELFGASTTSACVGFASCAASVKLVSTGAFTIP